MGEEWGEPRRRLAQAIFEWTQDPCPVDIFARALRAWREVTADEGETENFWFYWQRAHGDAAELAEAAGVTDQHLLRWLRDYGAAAYAQPGEESSER